VSKPRQSDEERIVQFFTTVDNAGAIVLFRVVKGILSQRGIDATVHRAAPKKRASKKDAQLKIPGTPDAT
jgi:hypothetical protein